MTREQLFEAIGEIGEGFLREGESRSGRLRLRYLVGAAAACLAVTGCVWFYGQKMAPASHEAAPGDGISLAQATGAVVKGADETDAATFAATSAAAEDTDRENYAQNAPAVTWGEEISFQKVDLLPQTQQDYALPDGYFFYTMTAQDIGGLWGQDAMEALDGYRLSGQVIYDGNGDAWSVTVNGQSDAGEFHLELAPGHLPYDCCIVQAPEYEQDYNGTTITALEVGENYYLSALYEGKETVGFRASSADTAVLETLAALSFDQDSGLRLRQLHTDQIPNWRSEKLDEAAARAEEGFGSYLPTTVPERFVFRMAYREMGQDRDWLTVDYESENYGYLEITVRKYYEDLPIIDPAMPEAYDRDWYPSGDKVPDAFWDTWSNGVLLQKDLTEQTVAARCTVDDENDASCVLRVLYPDGTLVEITGKITAQEAWKLIDQIG